MSLVTSVRMVTGTQWPGPSGTSPWNATVAPSLGGELEVGLDTGLLLGRDDRPHVRVEVRGVAHLDGLRPLDHSSDELIVERIRQEQSGARLAGLPLVEAEREERSVDRRVQVGVGQDDVRSLATELERDLLDVLRRLLGDEPAHRGRPGERDLADIGVS